VPQTAVADTLVVPYNDLNAVRTIFAAYPGQIAAVTVEPVAANMGVVRPVPGFLEGLRETTARDGALLIFDEVITGFRVGRGGAQARDGITPDLTCLGKIIGGGLPIGAYGGRRDIMETVAPLGPVYQAGTLSGNPVAMAAGAATLRRLSDPALYAALEVRTADLVRGLEGAARAAGVTVSVVHDSSLLTVFFTPAPPSNLAEAAAADTARFGRFFGAMLDRGVLLPPSQFEAWFLSAAHTDADIETTVEAASEAFREVA
jgi:glutamate-1-semialdehyde 2,1-aminomutase